MLLYGCWHHYGQLRLHRVLQPRVCNRAEAEQTLAALTEKARSVESEPCKITPTFTEESDGVRLDIDFTFACEAEMLIFQLGLR